MAKDYYAILGIPKGADEKEIKAAYRKLARKYHPDVNPNDPEAENKFKEISEAYAVLSDPERRRGYDAYGVDPQQGGIPTGGYQGGTEDFGGFGDIFGRFFGGFGDGLFAGMHPNAQPRDAEIPVTISLDEVDKGTKRTLNYQTQDACPQCKGTGMVRTRGGEQMNCPQCGGTGLTVASRKVEITIPIGIQSGKKLRVPGGGHRGANGRGGDLFVLVQDIPHARFKRNGDDLEVEIEIPFPIAALGGEVRVQTLHSSAKMAVPAGTQSGQSFRLRGQGLHKLKGGQGDLIAKAKISVPKSLSDEQRALIEQLKELETTA